jgi:hypothetical protein
MCNIEQKVLDLLVLKILNLHLNFLSFKALMIFITFYDN